MRNIWICVNTVSFWWCQGSIIFKLQNKIILRVSLEAYWGAFQKWGELVLFVILLYWFWSAELLVSDNFSNRQYKFLYLFKNW